MIDLKAMDVTKPYTCIGFGAIDITKPYEFMWFGAGAYQGQPTKVSPGWGVCPRVRPEIAALMASGRFQVAP